MNNIEFIEGDFKTSSNITLDEYGKTLKFLIINNDGSETLGETELNDEEVKMVKDIFGRMKITYTHASQDKEV